MIILFNERTESDCCICIDEWGFYIDIEDRSYQDVCIECRQKIYQEIIVKDKNCDINNTNCKNDTNCKNCKNCKKCIILLFTTALSIGIYLCCNYKAIL